MKNDIIEKRCEHCEELKEDFEFDTTDDSIELCESCYDIHTDTCNHCGNRIYEENGNYVNGNFYCDNCVDEIEEEPDYMEMAHAAKEDKMLEDMGY